VNSQWYRFVKHFQGGTTEHFVFLDEDISEDDLKHHLENWAKGSAGGHNYGYRCQADKVDQPDLVWLEDQITAAFVDHTRSASRLKAWTRLYDEISGIAAAPAKEIVDKVKARRARAHK